MKYLIAGLGNIGPEYDLTRHNIGFLILDRLADKENLKFSSERYANVAEYKFRGRTLILIKPTTFMNLSGKAVNYWLKDQKIDISNLLVITDDLALPYGKIRLRGKGSNGGHNGLGNIQDVLSTEIYSRLRFGVGSNFPKGKQVDYVLSNFDTNEMAELPIHMDQSILAIQSFTTLGIERTMTTFNK